MTSHSTILIDVGTGNLHSVMNALQSLELDIKVASNPSDLMKLERVILPGVGAFGKFMEGLHRTRLEEPLINIIQRGIPLLGICVGMQALFESSDEMGTTKGLGLLSGKVTRFPDNLGLKVPHTGWNQIWPRELKSPTLLANIDPGNYAYFNHSYFCLPDDVQDISAATDYGISFSSMVQKGSIYGVQFHPEKSQGVGLKILQNFMKL